MVPPLLSAALGYAARGWPVFPLRRKVPWISNGAGGNGVHDATADPERITDWWSRVPDANIGVPTGAPIRNRAGRRGPGLDARALADNAADGVIALAAGMRRIVNAELRRALGRGDGGCS